MIFSSPLIKIVVERMNFKQNSDQYPINFPPYKTIFCGNNSAGRNIIEIIIIPVKKNNEKTKLLSIFKNYIKSFKLCLFLITWIFEFLISNSAAFGLRL